MSNKELEKAIAALSLEDCKRASALIRQRVGVLADKPPESIAKQCSVGGTASVKVEHGLATGTILEVTGACLVLMFGDGSTAATTMDRLDPKGFGLPVTHLPPREVYGPMPEDCGPMPDKGIPVLCMGQLYVAEEIGKYTVEARRVMVSAVPEFLDAAAVERLVPARKPGKLCV